MKSTVMTVVFGLIGLLLTPIGVFALVLSLGYALDPRCGTPGDSGGCEMGAATIAMASALPGLVGGAVLGLMLSRRDRKT